MTISEHEAQQGKSLWARLRSNIFHFYFLLRRPMTLGVRGLIYDREENAVFLIRHTYVPGWQLPGGGVETSEIMADALARELVEEGNIEITAPAVLKSLHFNRQASRRDHVALYLIESYRQTAPKRRDHEIAEAGFFKRDALPPETTPATLRRIAEVLDGAEVSPYW
jgi:ADP-ribose pyrophosphatase YjhB (NUDIX family)